MCGAAGYGLNQGSSIHSWAIIQQVFFPTTFHLVGNKIPWIAAVGGIEDPYLSKY